MRLLKKLRGGITQIVKRHAKVNVKATCSKFEFDLHKIELITHLLAVVQILRYIINSILKGSLRNEYT